MNYSFVTRSFTFRGFTRLQGFCVAIVAASCVVLLNAPVQADTSWTAGSTTVSDLLDASKWSNQAPIWDIGSTANPGVISFPNAGSEEEPVWTTITVSTSPYKPGAAGKIVDLTFDGYSETILSNRFIPLGDVSSGTAAFTFRLKDHAKVTANENFWGGTNSASVNITPVEGNDYVLYQYYEGNSSFTSNEWWAGMSVKTSITISDKASVTAQGGTSGMGWGSCNSVGSILKMTDNATLSVVAWQQNKSTVNMYKNSKASASGKWSVSGENAQLTLYDSSSLTGAGEINVNDKGVLNVYDNATLNANGVLRIGDNADGAVFNQTGGTVNSTANVYFSYHANSTVNLSGGEFISTGTIFGSDQNGKVGNVNMSGNASLKAATLSWGQHGVTNITMKDNARMEATTALQLAYHFDAGDLTQTTLVMSGNSAITAAGNLVTFKGLGDNKRTGDNKGYLSIVMTDNASITVNGNFWGGIDKTNYAPQALDGNTYVQEMTFSGNSSFTAQKEWWVAMTAKSKILIEDNARITSGSGTSGMGWGANGEGSLLTMTGGSIQVSNWNIQGSEMNMSGSSSLKAGGNLTLDKTNPILTVADDAVINVTGVTYIGYSNLDSTASFTQTGGLVQAKGNVYFSRQENANVSISGGKFIANGDQLYVTDLSSRTANIALSGDGYLQAKDLRLSQHGTTNLTMSDNSAIKTTAFNIAYNYTEGDNAQTVVTMGDSASVSTVNLYFFGGNAEKSHAGAAYGALTLNDNAQFTVESNAILGMGDATGVIGGNEYSAVVTFNGNSEFSTGMYMAPTGTKSLTNVNNSATFNASTIDIGTNSVFNLNSGTVNLNPYGMINAVQGMFNANGGTINLSAPDSPSDGDQMLVGLFANDGAANNVMGKMVAPDGWELSVVSINNNSAIVANYGSASTNGVKIWTGAGSDTSMSTAENWAGDVDNPTGYVVNGTNSLTDIAGNTIVSGGSNTFSGTVPAAAALLFTGGASTITSGVAGTINIEGGSLSIGDTISGTVTIDGGSLTVSSGNKNLTGSMVVNGGSFLATNSFWNEKSIVINGGSFTVKGSYLPMRYSSTVEINGGQVTLPRVIICDTKGSYTCLFEQNDGTTTVSGNIDVAEKANTTGTLKIAGGVLTCSATINIGVADNSTGLMEVTGGSVTANRIIVGRKSAGDAAILRVTGGSVTITQDLCGSGGAASGKTYVSGTGQIIFDSAYTAAKTIREQTYFGIEGSGADGQGALRFIQSAVSASMITLTGNATIGVDDGQTLTMESPINAASSNYVLTIKGGTVDLQNITDDSVKNFNLIDATLKVDSSAPSVITFNDLKGTNGAIIGTDKDLILNNDNDSKFSGAITANNVEKTGAGTLQIYAAKGAVDVESLVVSSGRLDMKEYFTGSIEVQENATLSPGNSVGSLTVDGDFTLDSAGILLLEQDETGMDQLIANNLTFEDNSIIELSLNAIVPGATYNIIVQTEGEFDTDQQDPSYWLNLIDGDLPFYMDLSVVNNNTVQLHIDANKVPEPSTWALLILGAAGLLYWRKQSRNA